MKRVRALLVFAALLSLACGSRAPGSYAEKPDDCPDRSRAPQGVGMALSGGGYRATLFHAGALRRMNELGLLHQADEISSVSGGSITNGQLAVFYEARGGRPDGVIPTAEWDAGFADPIHELTSKDIRSKPILEKIFLPWNWFLPDFGVERMASELDRHFDGMRLTALGDEPDFVFQATDLSFGVSWEFRPWRVGSYRAGYLLDPPDEWSLGQAVAASAAFPPVFAPMEMQQSTAAYESYRVAGEWNPDLPAREQNWQLVPQACWKPGNWSYAMQNLRLQDGGVYDNFGLEPIWKDRNILFVSNAGGPFSNAPDSGFVKRTIRFANVMNNQSRSLRTRMLFDLADQDLAQVSYWSTREPSDGSQGVGGYSAELAWNYIARIRTDLDVFSEAEQAILENHGYLVADAAIRETVADEGGLLGLDDAAAWPALVPPHPEWLPPNKTGCELKKALYADDPCQD